METKNNFQGKKAVVTAASTGIGRAISVALATRGARIALVARSIDGLKRTQELIEEKGGTAEIFSVDLRDKQAIDKFAQKVLEKWVDIDFIVNAAGVWHNKKIIYANVPLSETPEDQINEVLEVGITAPILLTRKFLPTMIKNKRGKILQISGTFEDGASGWLHYYVSKKAIEHFTVGLSEELRPHQIQVNAISPSDTYTEAYQRFFTTSIEQECIKPEDVANLAIFLLSEAADNITGQIITIKSKFAR